MNIRRSILSHVMQSGYCLIPAMMLLLSSCLDAEKGTTTSDLQQNQYLSETENPIPDNISTGKDNTTKKRINYNELRQKITYGKATLFEVKQALTEEDVGALTNTVHALYSMRWHRAVYHLLYQLWEPKQELYPEFAWDLISQPPVRIALASTINRIQIQNTQEYKAYIRSFKYDKHEFIVAQVVIALGLNGDPVDVPYLVEMSNSDNRYITQTSITALGLMNNEQAKQAMLELLEKYAGTARGNLISDVFGHAYAQRKVDPESISIPDSE